jgi:hypothetical protein
MPGIWAEAAALHNSVAHSTRALQAAARRTAACQLEVVWFSMGYPFRSCRFVSHDMSRAEKNDAVFAAEPA